jgi:hypothetical protein
MSGCNLFPESHKWSRSCFAPTSDLCRGFRIGGTSFGTPPDIFIRQCFALFERTAKRSNPSPIRQQSLSIAWDLISKVRSANTTYPQYTGNVNAKRTRQHCRRGAGLVQSCAVSQRFRVNPPLQKAGGGFNTTSLKSAQADFVCRSEFQSPGI